jgi:hypothetical protein
MPSVAPENQEGEVWNSKWTHSLPDGAPLSAHDTVANSLFPISIA